MFELIDEQSNKVKFVGSEKECLDYSMQFPNCNFIMNDLNKNNSKKGKNNESTESDN